MPIEMLGLELLSEDELVHKINREVKSGRPKLKRKMVTYLRDVLGLIPKAIRLRTSKKVGGPKAYYTPEAVQSVIIVMTENWQNNKTLREIKKEKKDILREAHQKTDLFRQKLNVYNQLIKLGDGAQPPHDDIHVEDSAQMQIIPAQGSPLDDVSEKLKISLEKAQKLLNNKCRDEKLLDNLMDKIYLQYLDRLKCRIKDFIKEKME